MIIAYEISNKTWLQQTNSESESYSFWPHASSSSESRTVNTFLYITFLNINQPSSMRNRRGYDSFSNLFVAIM